MYPVHEEKGYMNKGIWYTIRFLSTYVLYHVNNLLIMKSLTNFNILKKRQTSEGYIEIIGYIVRLLGNYVLYHVNNLLIITSLTNFNKAIGFLF
jgi:hypothetical protein